MSIFRFLTAAALVSTFALVGCAPQETDETTDSETAQSEDAIVANPQYQILGSANKSCQAGWPNTSYTIKKAGTTASVCVARLDCTGCNVAKLVSTKATVRGTLGWDINNVYQELRVTGY